MLNLSPPRLSASSQNGSALVREMLRRFAEKQKDAPQRAIRAVRSVSHR
jgi:hypothetical protein